MYPIYTIKLGLRTRKVDVSIQKIDKSYLDTFRMIMVDYLVKDNLRRV